MYRELLRILFNNIGVKSVSVIIAFLVWVAVLGSKKVEVSKEIPLQILTAPKVVVANDVPQKVTFKLSGPKAFLRGVLNRPELPIVVNLTGTNPGLVTYRFFSDSIHLPIGVKAVSITPQAILIKLENEKEETIPVRLDLKGSLPEGYELVSATVDPPQARVRGAKGAVSAVTELITRPIELSTLRQDLNEVTSFEAERYPGVQILEPLPRMKLEVRAVSANFRIKNVQVKILSTLQSRTREPNITLFVRAEQEDLKTLNPNQVTAEVDLRGKSKGEYHEPVKVTLPPKISLVKIVPERVHITLH